MEPENEFQQLDDQDERNRRVHPRVERPPVDLSGIWGEVVDISLTGIAVMVTDPIDLGTRLDLVVTDARTHDQRWIPAEVMWSEGKRTGLRWVDLSDDDRAWLLERFSAWLNLYRQTLRVLEVRMEGAAPPEPLEGESRPSTDA